VVIDPAHKARIEAFDDSLYARIEQHYNGFKDHQLVSCHSFSEDWSNWEIHPNGDEVLMLLSGKVTLVLGQEAKQRGLALAQPGTYVIVPKNTWHTARTDVETKMLFITSGEATVNKEC
jgi:mannose-6-phosphate isomerase-like protein (cupin superfamily)